jgi:hypothetical protein
VAAGATARAIKRTSKSPKLNAKEVTTWRVRCTKVDAASTRSSQMRRLMRVLRTSGGIGFLRSGSAGRSRTSPNLEACARCMLSSARNCPSCSANSSRSSWILSQCCSVVRSKHLATVSKTNLRIGKDTLTQPFLNFEPVLLLHNPLAPVNALGLLRLGAVFLECVRIAQAQTVTDQAVIPVLTAFLGRRGLDGALDGGLVWRPSVKLLEQLARAADARLFFFVGIAHCVTKLLRSLGQWRRDARRSTRT